MRLIFIQPRIKLNVNTDFSRALRNLCATYRRGMEASSLVLRSHSFQLFCRALAP